MSVWDTGTYEAEKWREDEIIVILHGREGGGLEAVAEGLGQAEDGGPAGEGVRLALIRTEKGSATGSGGSSGKENWLAHLMKDQAKGHWRRGTHAEVRPSDAEVRRPDARGGPPPSPMLAQSGTAGLVREGDWMFEMKWDGIRAIVDTRSGSARLISRNGIDQTLTYPELADLAELGPAVLDGEIIAQAPSGRPDFGLLQQRMNLSRPADVERARRAVPVRIVLFDLLEYEGRDLTGLPFRERRAALELLAEGGLPASAQLSPVFDGSIDDVLEASDEHGLEGVIAKRPSARYEAGRRSGAWVKIKHEKTQEVVVAGWREGKGGRAGTVGSLLLGIPDDDGVLRYAGRVGSGFTDRMLAEVSSRLRPLERKTPPLEDVPREDTRDAHWVTPKLVAEVRYGELTSGGRLRHPVWRGWRPDKAAADVVLEG
jgi:bifunctional non-homologous end joining protein LigD